MSLKLLGNLISPKSVELKFIILQKHQIYEKGLN